MDTITNWVSVIKSKLLQPDDINYVIYHGSCADGTGSAYVAWKYLSNKFPDRQVVYCPAQIGALPPDDIEGKNVLICDYSYKKPILLELLKKVNKLLIIDHHKSAEKDLTDIDDKYKIFDMTHSGAMLTWMYFYPTIESPLLIKYIEDRDIWTKKLYKNDEFTAWFYTLPHSFEEYHKYTNDTLLLKMIEEKGTAFIDLNTHNINECMTFVAPKFMKIKDNYYFVGYINSTVLKSDIGNKVFTKYHYIDFSAVYSLNDWENSTSFSLRSTDKHLDVGDLATSLGAGGHRNSSGLKLQYVTNILPGTVYDVGSLYNILSDIYTDTLLINNFTFNVIYFPATLHARKLATYMLQTKYNDIQECQAIIMHRDNITENKKYHISIGVNYSPNAKYTHFTIVFDKIINDNMKKFIYKWFTLSDFNTGIRYDGCHNTIPLNTDLIIRKPLNDDDLFIQ